MIRQAIDSDIPALVHMGSRFHAASGYADFGVAYDPEKMAESFRTHIASPDCLLLIAERDERPIGMACAALTTLYMSHAPVCAELYWWINPEDRGGADAVRLKTGLENWGRERGAVVAAMSSLAAISDSPADAIFARTGYRNTEKSWIKRL